MQIYLKDTYVYDTWYICIYKAYRYNIDSCLVSITLSVIKSSSAFSIHANFPGPAVAKQARLITPPPPCLTVGMRSLWWDAVHDDQTSYHLGFIIPTDIVIYSDAILPT